MTIRSLYSGVSGLRTQSNAIDTIGNNIANVNTVGFRRARMTSADLFSATLSSASGATATRGGINPRQIGLGTQTDSIDTIFTQGNPQQTGRLLDLAIRGGGFFQLADGNGATYFTRAGNFGLDEMGYVTKPSSGLRLIGQIANAQGDIDSTTPPQAIKIDFSSLSDAVPTGVATLGGNLSSTSTSTGATSLNTLVTLFNHQGIPLGLNAGDVIKIGGGTYNTVPPGVPVNIPATDILTVSPTTTLGELASSLRSSLRTLTGSTTLDVTVDATGGLRIETGPETITDLSVSAVGVDGTEKTRIRSIFNDGELDGNIDLLANTSVTTGVFRQADATSSTEVFDSQGNARTVITTFARDTRNVPAPAETLLTGLFDDASRSLGVTAGTTNIVIAAGSTIGGTTTVTDTAVLAVAANSTLEDLRSALETQLNTIGGVSDITVSLLPDGSFRVSSPTSTITDMRIHIDNDAVNGGSASTAGTITRLFNNRDFGVASATEGLDVTAGTYSDSNTFHTSSQILNSWTYQVVVPHGVNQPPSAATGELVFLANGNFDNYGRDSSNNIISSNPIIQFDPDGVDPQNGGVDSLTIQFDFSDLTQNASTTTASILSQDGSPVGRLETIDISNDGVVTGVFSNGTSRTLARILVASFANDGGLLRAGDNLFVQSSNSGEPVLGVAGTLARGEISSNELELSNVDISEEFVNLILAQRAFQANARVISTGDNILQELVNLVR
ncbi:MAG: flagellar hook-basal body complex protein [Candidatus Omnitrophica bacterium]|nr:MAG: Flagellar hook protein FlgE [Candidatus Hinthialibacteria bacterium OLB16]MBK7496930.1 flagellar hook-basal body complex protein [Candidatus Omnitrophota bacterium]MCK6497112.1 flagellar hook-basal body complex protein [bacterium]MCL4735085.1 flagellar hook-basal body complex protein [Candidatus Omnitrophota bacterium]